MKSTMIRQLILSVCERMLERERMRLAFVGGSGHLSMDVFVSDVILTFVSKVPLS